MHIGNRTHCDKCTGLIENNRCPCGIWFNTHDQPFAVTLEKAIYAYDYICEEYQTFTPLSGDHYSGNCIVLFKGDNELCLKVKAFIEQQNFIPKD